ncbi:MAG TPA: hypothetical protein DCG54_10065 [Anaerolineae bacterium]|nr:hypothetical protein [Anaerolineae bacterium]HAE59826.1 hypothetical protein [Anaerolineae bacterium]
MNTQKITLFGLIIKTSVVHTITYFLMGLLAYAFLGYAERFAEADMASWMRQTSDPIVMAGPLFQPLRGIIFALAFYPLREILFGRKNGWLTMGWLLVALGILSTFGPTPGSIEGMIYTILPISGQLTGWLEVIPQALLLSAILHYWVNHPEKKWLNWALGIVFFVMMLLPAMGLLIG